MPKPRWRASFNNSGPASENDSRNLENRQNLGGLTQFPLVQYGCCVEVVSPEEFNAKVPGCRADSYFDIRDVCDRYFPNDGKTAERVVAAIEQELR